MNAATAINPALLDAVPLQRAVVEKGGLRHFVELAWSQVESVPFVGGWHLDEICRHLEAVSDGTIRRLIVNIPPGMSKSLLVSVFWPAWDWLRRPDRKWMFGTFDSKLALRDALRCRQLVSSAWFQERWSDKVRIYDGDDKQNTMSVYHTSKGGLRFSTTTKGGGTGWHAHIQVVDDPTKPQDVQDGGEKARAALDRTWAWWQNTMASRKADPHDFSRVVIMQRLAEDDLAGRLAKEGGYELLCLPMRFVKPEACRTSIGGDRRAEDGELLCPARFDEATVAETERDMGPMTAAAQLAQKPAPAGGAIFKRDWLLKEWEALPAGAQMIQSWDCAFKGLDTSDYVVGQVWAKSGGRFYLVDQVRDKMDFNATCAAIISLTAKWPKAREKIIEDKANGPAVEQMLRDKVSGIVMVQPEGGKIARANGVSPLFAAGNVHIPTPKTAPWIHDWREEMAQFPRARHDDQVDATTQALLHLHDSNVSSYLQAMKNAREGA